MSTHPADEVTATLDCEGLPIIGSLAKATVNKKLYEGGEVAEVGTCICT